MSSRQRMESLRAREKNAPRVGEPKWENSGRRIKLQRVLQSKLGAKFNGGNATQVITEEISNLMSRRQRDKITTSDLNELEANVRSRCSRKAPSARTDNSYESKETDNSYESKESKESGAVPKLPDDSYQVFTEAQWWSYQRDVKKRQDERKLKQFQTKKALDEQVMARKSYQSESKVEDEKYAKIVNEDVRRHYEEEKSRKEAAKAKNLEVKKQRDAQLKETRERAKRNEDIKRREEEKVIADAKRELAVQEKRSKDMQEEQRKYMKKVQRDNKDLKLKKEQQRLADQAYDKLLQKQYVEKQEKQEKDRQEAFARMKAKSANNQKMYVKNVEETLRKEREVEERALRVQEQRWALENEKARKREEKRLQDKKDMNRVLAQQCEMRRAEKREQEEKDRSFASAYKRDALDAIAAEEAAAQKRKERNLRHKKELQNQIKYNAGSKRDTDSSVMSEMEQAINQQKYREISQNPELATYISGRIRATSSTQKRDGRRRNLDGEEIL